MTAAKTADPGPTNTDKKVAETKAATPPETPAAEVKPTGSPVTAGTKENNNGAGGVAATIGNESPKKVDSQTTDNSPATGPGNHANIVGATQDPKNPAVVKPEDALTEASRTGNAPDQTGDLRNAGSPKVGSEPGTEADAEFEKALNEPDIVPVPSDDDLDHKDVEETGSTLQERHAEARKAAEEKFRPTREALDNIAALVLDTVGSDTKDSVVVWGYGGKQISLGDLRTIARNWRENRDE